MRRKPLHQRRFFTYEIHAALWVFLLWIIYAIPSGAQVITCSTSGGVLYFDGTNYVCSAALSTSGGGINLSVNNGNFTSKTQNGWRNATQFISGGNDGIANAAGSTPNQTVLAEPTYPGTEQFFKPTGNYSLNTAAAALPNGTHLHDLRSGTQWDLFHNPTAVPIGGSATLARLTSCIFDAPPSPLSGPSTASTFCDAENNFTTGSGISFGSSWYINMGHRWFNTFLARGISQVIGTSTIKAGVGDSATLYAYHNCLGGITAGSDEGCEPVMVQGGMLYAPLQGTPTVSGTGVTSIPVQCTTNCNYAGDGRYLAVTSQASSSPFYIDSAPVVAGGAWTQAIVSNASTFPVSTAYGIVTSASGHTGGSVGTNPQSATLTVGTLTGTFTTGAPVCLAGGYHEVAQVTAVGTPSTTQTITANVRNPVIAGMEVWQGGMCGQGIVFLYGTDWTTLKNGHKWFVWPVAGSPDAHTLRVFGNAKGGQNGPQTIYYKSDISLAMGSITRSSNVVTGSLLSANNSAGDMTIRTFGSLVTKSITGSSDPSLDGTITGVTFAPDATNGQNGPMKFVWNQTGADIATAQTGTMNITGVDYAIVLPTMEVVSAGQVNGTGTGIVPLTVEYNNNTISTSDTLEHPVHGYFGGVGLSLHWNGGRGPLNMGTTPGFSLTTTGSVGQSMWINNANPSSDYAGLGGAATPETAIQLNGVYGSLLIANTAPLKLGSTPGAVIRVGCPPVGCTGGNSTYTVISLQGYTFNQFLTTWNPKDLTYTLSTADSRWTYTPALTSTNKPMQFTNTNSDPATLLPGMLWTRNDLGRPRWYNTTAHSLAFQDELPLAGTTGSIGGASIAGGSCATGTATATGAVVGTPVAVSASDGSLPNPLIILSAAVTATNTVTVQLCAVATVTPTAKNYKVSVIR